MKTFGSQYKVGQKVFTKIQTDYWPGERVIKEVTTYGEERAYIIDDKNGVEGLFYEHELMPGKTLVAKKFL